MTTDPKIDANARGFPMLFTRDEFKEDVTELMLLFVQQAQFTFMADSSDQSKAIWGLLGSKASEFTGLGDAGETHGDLGLEFSDIQGLSMVQTLMSLYDYGVLGILDPSNGRLDYFDGYENQVSRLCYDINRSAFLQEWANNGLWPQAKAAQRSLYICELANARLMLEGSDEGFFLDERDEGFLSVRQLALLSGMTEPSIRTLLSRSRKGSAAAATDESTLVTVTDGKNVSIAIAVAKTWLQAKGRHVPITYRKSAVSNDFTERRFFSRNEFEREVAARTHFLMERDGADALTSRIAATGLVYVQEPIGEHPTLTATKIGEGQLLDASLMQRLATALELPADRFALRAAETVTQERLRSIEAQIKKLSSLTS
jgi:hypothetical protein